MLTGFHKSKKLPRLYILCILYLYLYLLPMIRAPCGSACKPQLSLKTHDKWRPAPAPSSWAATQSQLWFLFSNLRLWFLFLFTISIPSSWAATQFQLQVLGQPPNLNFSISFSFLNISSRDPILVPAPRSWAARATQSQLWFLFSQLVLETQFSFSFLTISITGPILVPA